MSETTETTETTVIQMDRLTTSQETWNSQETSPIELWDENRNVLASYDYEERPLFMGENKTDFKMLVCSDNGQPVGIPFKDSYHVLGNRAFLDVIEGIMNALDGMDIKYRIATTGTLKNRGRVFLSIALEGFDEFQVGDRMFKAFLNCLNSVDKSCSVVFANNTFCVCCSNTFASALKETDDTPFHAKIKHTKSMADSLKDIPKIVEYFISGNERILVNLTAFESIGCTLTQAEQVFAAFLADGKGEATLATRSLNMIETMKGLFNHGKGNNGETLLDLFSGATEYFTHQSAGKFDIEAAKAQGGNGLNMKQIESSEIGNGATQKQRFYALLCEMTEKGKLFDSVAKVGEHILVVSRKAQADKREAK